jgi:hypothetical protein
MDPEGIEFIHGHKDKPSLMEARMRNRHIRLIDHTVPIEENVQIHRARSRSMVVIPSECAFDLLQRREETVRSDSGFNLYHPVEKPLCSKIGPIGNRFGLI